MTAIPTLTTERLTLRAPAMEDYESVAAFLGSDRAAFIGGKRTRRESFTMLAATIGHWPMRGFGMWSVDETATGKSVGLVGLHYPVDWPGREIGWWITDPASEGRGLAFEAAVAARRHAYETLGWNNAISVIQHGNDRSVRLAERMGAVRDGTAEIAPREHRLIYRHSRPEVVQ